MAKISRSKAQNLVWFFPGTSPDTAGLVRLKMAAPIKPAKPQSPCDIGLFSDDAAQLDLCEMFQDSTEED